MQNKIAFFRSSSKRRENLRASQGISVEPKFRLELLPSGKRTPVLSSELKKRLFRLTKERFVER